MLHHTHLRSITTGKQSPKGLRHNDIIPQNHQKSNLPLSLVDSSTHFSSAPIRLRPSRGFTIVELLIVIVVIGILAAISIVAYNGISNNANDAAVQSDFTNFAKKYELARAENASEQYPNPTTAMGMSLTKGAYMLNRNNIYLCINAARDRYVLAGQSKSGKYFAYESSAGKTTAITGVMNGAATCVRAGTTDTAASISLSAYVYNSTTGEGTWQAWVN